MLEKYEMKAEHLPKILKESEYADEIAAFLNKLFNYQDELFHHSHNIMCHQAVKEWLRELNLTNEQIEYLKAGALVHDIGKILIPLSILNGTTPILTPDERRTVQWHVDVGYEKGKKWNLPREVLEIIRYHHENYDGTGYMSGLSGDNIPYLARIMSIIDTYDVLVRGRSYQRKYTDEEIPQVFLTNSPSKYDPILTQKFVHILTKTDNNIAN